jgi:hypothetical protein
MKATTITKKKVLDVQVTSDIDFFFFAYLMTVIPDYAKMSWSVRADVWDALEPLRDRVVKCLECA